MMFEQIADDTRARRFDAWGMSTVIDENIDAPVIEPEVFEQLHEAASITATWPIGNAGLLHVYGYLLSTIETPYGLKRDRWLDGELAIALGLSPDAFLLESAADAGETVLQRVTESVLPRLEHSPDSLFLRDELSDDGQVFRTLVLPPVGRQSALLYGVHDGDRMRAITAFPVTPSSHFLSSLAQQPARMRYNAATTSLPPRSPLTS
ncbi:amino acid deaminase [Glaciihabitans sp. UYNi722]|uniref:amino acid deaminase n=1 Tax=Glaciihabitans sp. UYNi722 TaxID=3156344 RepID=UPI003397DCD5